MSSTMPLPFKNGVDILVEVSFLFGKHSGSTLHINHKGVTQVLAKYWIRHWVIVAHLIYASAIFAIKIIFNIKESIEEPYHKLDSSRYHSGMNGWHYYENLLYRMGIDFPMLPQCRILQLVASLIL